MGDSFPALQPKKLENKHLGDCRSPEDFT